MKPGDIVSLNDINKYKNKIYINTFNSIRYAQLDGKAWWNKMKKKILKETKFKVIEIPNI